jgi:hypothetical protein
MLLSGFFPRPKAAPTPPHVAGDRTSVSVQTGGKCGPSAGGSRL